MKQAGRRKHDMPLAWGMQRITYSVMTDAQGVQWAVPTTVDGKPVEHLRKYDPKLYEGTFERITIK